MADLYKIQYANNTLTYPGWNGYVGYEQPGYPITYLSDEHVHLTGDPIYIPGQSGITLDSAYDTYYRISGYEVDNGEIVDGVLIPTGPCTVKAVEKVNSFTASGGWEKGSNYQVPHRKNVTGSVVRYATASYKTDNVPADWYATSNRWNPNNASAYSFTGNPSVTFWLQGGTDKQAFNFGYVTAQWKVGSTVNVQSAFNATRKKGQFTTLYTYKPSYTTTTQNNTQYLSALMKRDGTYGDVTALLFYYSASLTTGTWTATGIAP